MSKDSIISITNYSDTTSNYEEIKNDSSIIIVNGIEKTFLGKKNKMDNATPEFFAINKLEDSLYALIAITPWTKCQLKYIWILKVNKGDFEITKKIFFPSSRLTKDKMNEINFSYKSPNLILNNNNNGIRKDRPYVDCWFSGLTVLNQLGEELETVKTQKSKNFRYVKHSKRFYSNQDEINYIINVKK